jgi:hypothetical protein
MSTERLVPRPPLPPPRPRSASREYIGNDETAEDVTRCTDRELLLRALNEILQMQYTIGQLTAGLADTKAAALDARAVALRVEAALGAEKADRLIGDANTARAVAESYPNLEKVVDQKITQHKLTIATEATQELEESLKKTDDRQWAVKLAFVTVVITSIVTGSVALIVRMIEASIRGHW